MKYRIVKRTLFLIFIVTLLFVFKFSIGSAEAFDKSASMEQGYSRSDAAAEALKWVSVVDYSEHQTGLAVDINANGINSTGEQVYDWLADNAWEYGFILRYPEDKTEITHMDYEPWHYRYVGIEAAKVIFEKNLCLEEYIDMLN